MPASWQMPHRWFVVFHILLIVAVATSVPIHDDTLDLSRQVNAEPTHGLDTNYQNSEPRRTEIFTDFSVDVRQFANLLSAHLMFDHLENASYLMTRKISRRIREVIQVNARLLSETEGEESSAVDVSILKGQLTGAVGSFIEDRLPIVWNKHASALDSRVLQTYIEFVVRSLCPAYPSQDFDATEILMVDTLDDSTLPEDMGAEKTTSISNACLEKRSRQFLSSVDRYVGNHVRRVMAEVVSNELPVLFETVQVQVKDILAHFNTHILSQSGSQLELVLTSEHFDANGKMDDYTWTNAPEEMNEILDTVSHWETPMDEDSQEGSSLHQGHNRLVSAVHHFAVLARTTQ